MFMLFVHEKAQSKMFVIIEKQTCIISYANNVTV